MHLFVVREAEVRLQFCWLGCFFHPSLKVCFLVDDDKSQQMVQDGLRCAYLSVRLASRSKGLSVAEDVILVADGDGSPFGDTLPVLYPMRGMLYGPRIFALLQLRPLTRAARVDVRCAR